MVDPFSVVESALLVKQLIDALRKSGEWERLVSLLDEQFGATTGLSSSQLQTWLDDPAFSATYLALSATNAWDERRDDLLAAILGLTAEDARRPTQSEQSLAEEVVAAIEALLPRAKRGDDVTRYVAQGLSLQLEGANLRLFSTDWAPEFARDLLTELADRHPNEALRLQEELRHVDSQRIAGLIKHPPRWIGREGSGLLYECLAATAEGLGSWMAALDAWEEASDRAGSDRPRAMVRASQAAHILGKPEVGEELIARAAELEPDHPIVLLAQAQRVVGLERLELADRVVARKPKQEAARSAMRAEALIELDRFEEADDRIREATQQGIPERRANELVAELAMQRNRAAWLVGGRVETTALVDAARAFEELRDFHRSLGAHAGSAIYISRAGDAYLRADETARVASLLAEEDLLDEELLVPGARPMFGEILLKAGLAERALRLVRDQPDQPSKVIHAMASVQAGSDTDLARAIPVLDAALEDTPAGTAASVSRLSASVLRGASWSDEAGRILEKADPVLAGLIRSRFLANLRQWDEAERTLAGLDDEPRVRHALLQLAIDEDDGDKVVRRARRALNDDADYALRFEAATALLDRPAGRSSGVQGLSTLADDGAAPAPVRSAALAQLSQIASDDGYFERALKLSDRWLDAAPDNENATWFRAFVLTRLGRFNDAYELLGGSAAQPRNITETRILVTVLTSPLRSESDLVRVVELCDEQSPRDERLEAAAMFASLGLDVGSAKLANRTSPSAFLERFPETELVTAIQTETPAELVEFIADLARQRTARLATVESEVFRAGSAPAATIAVAAGKEAAEVWRQLGRLPLGYANETLENLERADAVTALGLGAVWDVSAVAVASVLPGTFIAKLIPALSENVLSQFTLDDIVRSRESAYSDPHEMLTTDSAGQLTRWQMDPSELAEDSERANLMEISVSGFLIAPDSPPDDPGSEAEYLRANNVHRQLEGFVGTLAVARRMNLAVFSDDRLLRLRARQSGLRAFGTAAVVDALADHGDISDSDRLEIRRGLRMAGAIGTSPTGEEILADAERVGYSDPSALDDPTFYGADLRATLEKLVTVLAGIRSNAPSELDSWTLRAIHRLQTELPAMGGRFHAPRLLLFAWTSELSSNTHDLTESLAESLLATTIAADLGRPLDYAVLALAQALYGAQQTFASILAFSATFIDSMPYRVRHSLRLRLLHAHRILNQESALDRHLRHLSRADDSIHRALDRSYRSCT